MYSDILTICTSEYLRLSPIS